MYTTDQIDIVSHAKYCYKNYPTVVNEIPLEKNIYNNDMESYALIDNKLMESQLAIGTSSNIAQLALTYSYNFERDKFEDAACILAVLAQAAIDSAKRAWDINLNDEISRMKDLVDVETNGLPKFWQITKKDTRKASSDEKRNERDKMNRERVRAKVNKDLKCPMNYIYDIKLSRFRNSRKTIPIDKFLRLDLKDNDRRKSRAVEELIEKYSIELHSFYMEHKEGNWLDDTQQFILMTDFDELIADIKRLYISRNYKGLMSWLINRAFEIGHGVKVNENKSNTDKNKALLLNVLYHVNPDVFLECFKKTL